MHRTCTPTLTIMTHTHSSLSASHSLGLYCRSQERSESLRFALRVHRDFRGNGSDFLGSCSSAASPLCVFYLALDKMQLSAWPCVALFVRPLFERRSRAWECGCNSVPHFAGERLRGAALGCVAQTCKCTCVSVVQTGGQSSGRTNTQASQTDMYRQTCTDMHRHVQTCTCADRHGQTCTDMHRQTWTCTDRHGQTCTDRHVQADTYRHTDRQTYRQTGRHVMMHARGLLRKFTPCCQEYHAQ